MPRVHIPNPPDDFVAPLLPSLRTVLPEGDGVCGTCHGPIEGSYPTCWSCHTIRQQLSGPTDLVVPISLSTKQGQLYHVLKGYKRSRATVFRERFRLQLAAVVARFLSRHGDCIAERLGGDWDFITVVPSSTGRPPPHPLEKAICRSASVRNQLRRVLGLGIEALDYNQASDDGYQLLPGENVDGARVVLVDDTFTTGARSQSAASVLVLGGAEDVAIVPIGRLVTIDNPDYPAGQELWTAAGEIHFTFDRCCLCRQPGDTPTEDWWGASGF